jgi:hypothetical protein
MRFRVLSLPQNQFVIIADRVPDDLMQGEDETVMQGLSQNMVDRLTGCGGVIATNRTVEMEAWYPYG